MLCANQIYLELFEILNLYSPLHVDVLELVGLIIFSIIIDVIIGYIGVEKEAMAMINAKIHRVHYS